MAESQTVSGQDKVIPSIPVDIPTLPENRLGIPSKEVALTPEDQFYAIVQRGRKILEEVPPERWFRNMARFVVGLRREIEGNPGQFHPEVATFLRQYLLDATSESLDIQANRKHSGLDMEKIAVSAMDVLHEISEAVPFDEPEQPQVMRMSMKTLLRKSKEGRLHPDGYLLDKETKRDGQGRLRRFFKIYSPQRDEWFEFPFPKGEHILFKGGVSRVILKLAAGAPPETIEAELPPNDYDVVAYGDTRKVFQEAANIGVDQEGVEMMPSGDAEALGLFLTQRDVTLNQAFVGGEYLYFTPEAWASAENGIIDPLAFPRMLYGDNVIHHKGNVLANPRTMSRLVKFVVEGKAKGFMFTDLNAQFDMDCFALVLARKFSKKPNTPELLDKMYYMLKQMGQVHDGEEDILAVLDRIHSNNPYFTIDSPSLTPDGVVRWLSRKLAGYTFKRFRMVHKIPSGLELPRSEGDTQGKPISLEGYALDPERLKKIENGWEGFMQACDERSSAFAALSEAEQEAVRRAYFERKHAL